MATKMPIYCYLPISPNGVLLVKLDWSLRFRLKPKEIS